MSMTKFMHPRNIYKTPPNFKELAIEYPEFRKYVKQELSGSVSFDFKNLEALRCLTCTLLKKDFNLDVEIPLTKLIPTVPLRLNYILWIEDLMEISDTVKSDTHQIKGIDIGTGASCIYPLIACSKNGWSMIATDIDDDSIQCASQNVKRNNLADNIKVIQSEEDSFFGKLSPSEEYDFCMCNPPFFSHQQETQFHFKSRKLSRPRPKNAFCAAPKEVVAHGGEVDFITKLIVESHLRHLQNAKIKIYTTMVGHASSLPSLKKMLREIDVVSFKQTEFCQGNTTRWGLAWTFFDIDLRKVPGTTLEAQRKLNTQKKNGFQYQISNLPEDMTLNLVHDKLLELFITLEFNVKVKTTKALITYEIEAQTNTWSHQRRKRRAEERAKLNSSDSSIEDGESHANTTSKDPATVEKTTDLIANMQVKSPKKRELDDEDGYYNCKRFKNERGQIVTTPDVLLSAMAYLFMDKRDVHLELDWHNGNVKRDVLHQVLQYIKNNFKL